MTARQGDKRVAVWTDEAAWVWAPTTHPAIMDPDPFAAAERQRAKGQRTKPRHSSKAKRVYPLAGHAWCAACAGAGRHGRLEGHHAAGRNLMRCRLSGNDYASHPTPEATHPSTASISEAVLLRTLDHRLIEDLFAPDRQDDTIDNLLAAAAAPDPLNDQLRRDARRRLSEADARIDRLR